MRSFYDEELQTVRRDSHLKSSQSECERCIPRAESGVTAALFTDSRWKKTRPYLKIDERVARPCALHTRIRPKSALPPGNVDWVHSLQNRS